MYTLYFKPHACSLATHTILNLIDQPVNAINKDKVQDFNQLNPVNVVPVLKDSDIVVKEGVAVILYLLNKHENNLLASEGASRQEAIENMLFANATMHPAYSRLFFLTGAISNKDVRQEGLNAAAEEITRLWQVVEGSLGDKLFLGGERMSPADILLAVYSRWGQFFPVNIIIGEKTRKMIDLVMADEAFKRAVAEQDRLA